VAEDQKNMSTTNSADLEIKNKPDSQTKEVYQLLELAERLHEQINVFSQRIFYIYLSSILIFGIIVAIFITLYSSSNDIIRKQFGTGVALFINLSLLILMTIILFTLFYVKIIRSIKLLRKYDERSLNEVVRILRESVPPIIKKQNWSMLQIADFKIRLSRFEIGPSESFHIPVYTKEYSDLFAKIKGLWHLDYGFGSENLRIDGEGNYYYCTKNVEELVFTLDLEEYVPDKWHINWKKVIARSNKKGIVHAKESLDINHDWTEMNGQGEGKYPTHALKYTRGHQKIN
jgi:hypothetical protein